MSGEQKELNLYPKIPLACMQMYRHQESDCNMTEKNSAD